MNKPKMVKINLNVAKELVRMLDRLQEKLCIGCNGKDHEENSPLREAFS
jgi:hypothetical protein